MKNCEVRLAVKAEELEASLSLRRQVFVEEQGLFDRTDYDDHDSSSIFLNAWRNGTILMGTVRCYPDTDNAGVWWGGRLAVHEAYRLKGVGVYLIRAAVNEMSRLGVNRFLAHVQQPNVKLFEKLGWRSLGEPYVIQEIPHQLMEADLHVYDTQPHKHRAYIGS